MKKEFVVLVGGQVFDGTHLRPNAGALFNNDGFVGYHSENNRESIDRFSPIDIADYILSPGYIDLQVNGGGGLMFNDVPTVQCLKQIASAHRALGSVQILPTLITDSCETTVQAIEACVQAITEKTPGIAGLHLEGPHISVAKKGAHDARFIRPASAEDIEILLSAKARLPVLKVTVAPESITVEQVQTLSDNGIIVSLGHTAAGYDTCQQYAKAGARCVTHLFNAMSQFGSREPGLVGAALQSNNFSVGIICDGLHVHPTSLQIAVNAKQNNTSIYAVSDAMAVAGTDLTSFELNGRIINRQNNSLTLNDGTLAGADLDLTRSVNVLVNEVNLSVEQALFAATTAPANVIGLPVGLVSGNTRQSELNLIHKNLDRVTPLEEFIAEHA